MDNPKVIFGICIQFIVLAAQSRFYFHVRWSLNSWLDGSNVQISFLAVDLTRKIWNTVVWIVSIPKIQAFRCFKSFKPFSSNLFNHFAHVFSYQRQHLPPVEAVSLWVQRASPVWLGHLDWWVSTLKPPKTGLPKTGTPYASGMRDGHRHPGEGETAHGQRGATSAELQSFNGRMER